MAKLSLQADIDPCIPKAPLNICTAIDNHSRPTEILQDTRRTQLYQNKRPTLRTSIGHPLNDPQLTDHLRLSSIWPQEHDRSSTNPEEAEEADNKQDAERGDNK